MVIILVCIATGALVGFAIYRQVRAHLELRKALHMLENKGDLVIHHLTSVIQSLESLDITEGDVSKDIVSPVAEDAIYTDVRDLGSYWQLYMRECTRRSSLLERYRNAAIYIYGTSPEHLRCLESQGAEIHHWLEEGEADQAIELAYL